LNQAAFLQRFRRAGQYQRGTLASTGGIGGAGGGSISTPIGLPGTDASRFYNLDGLGNWKSTVYVPEGTTSATTEVRRHNSTNQLTQFGATPVSYDHGNNAASTDPLVQQRGNGNIVNDGTRILKFDALNRLVQVNSAASPTTIWAVYTYDALGRRVAKTVTNGGLPNNSALNGTTYYRYDGMRIIQDDSGSSTIAQYVWGIYIDELIQRKMPSGPFYLLSDLLTGASALTNSSGGIVEAYDTDAYGNTICYSGPGTDGIWFTNDDVTTTNPQNCYIFTERQFDPETQIYYYRARYYSPLLGRFVNRDPIDYEDSLNTYEYVHSRPTAYTDPNGTDVQSQCEDRCNTAYGGGRVDANSPYAKCMLCCSEAGNDARAAAGCLGTSPPAGPPAGAFNNCFTGCLNKYGAGWAALALGVGVPGLIVPKWPGQPRGLLNDDVQTVASAIRAKAIRAGYDVKALTMLSKAARPLGGILSAITVAAAAYLAGLLISCYTICAEDPCGGY
jgi:RHS repeat-associated protein